MSLRVALIGSTVSESIHELLETMGRDLSQRRIRAALVRARAETIGRFLAMAAERKAA